ncbi:hypothetical protein GCM10010187_04030 [Actinomadura coerulea]|nr:DUF5685 family protein [Actinomadura coerulea]GGP91832.1 hypothetical protein GCM10010187_04030 [Actinomadura coerulea]
MGEFFVFGVVRPCRHVLCGSLFKDWMAHLCGLCLTLRAEHGQAARLVTNYDGLLVSVLVEAQAPELSPRRKAGPCALRGMRTAEVVTARAQGAQLAAAASLLLAAGKTRDHVADGDGPYARRLVAAAAGRTADRWDAAGGRTGAAVGFDPAVLRDAVARQPLLEAAPGLGLLDLTEPTETAVAAVFAHTAVLAGKEGNTETLAEAGRFFGRLAHLIDAVEDLAEDEAAGAYNPLLATGTTLDEARRHADDALHGLRLALAELELERPRLVRALLDREAGRSVGRAFAAPADLARRGPRPPRPGWPIPCFTGTLVCATCGIFQPEWSDHHGDSCDDRCWCTRHLDGCDGGGCDGSCCDCCNCCDCCDSCDCCGCDCGCN